MESLAISFIKYTVKLVLSPLVMSFIVCIIGALCHLKQPKKRFGAGLVGLGVVWLLLCSQFVFSNAILRPLEYAYPPITLKDEAWQNARYLYTPGCYFYDVDTVEVSQWPRCSLTRLTQTAMMARISGKPIIVSAGHFLEDPNTDYAEQAKRFTQTLTDSPVIALSVGTNTEEELTALYAFTGDQPIAVITSATHMKRLMLLAKRIGFSKLTPVPVEHLSPPEFDITLNIPSVNSIQNTERALYEYFGLLFEHLRAE